MSNRFSDTSTVVKNLIIANAIIYLAQFVMEKQGIAVNLGGELVDKLTFWGALWDYRTPFFHIWQLVTNMFMHGSWMHLLFNMFTLWMFGPILERVWGAKRFFNFYMICGIVASLAQLLVGHFALALGASGAIMGVMAAFAYLFPNTSLYIMFIPVPVKAKYVIPAFMALDLFGGIVQVSGDNIAHWAHLGGALAGLILVFFWNKNNRKTFY